MKAYEGIFIFPTETSGDDALAQVSTWITKYEGQISEKNELGSKPLGYEIKGNRQGRLVVVEFELQESKVTELSKFLELQAGLLKYMISIPEPKRAESKYVSQPEEEVEAGVKE